MKSRHVAGTITKKKKSINLHPYSLISLKSGYLRKKCLLLFLGIMESVKIKKNKEKEKEKKREWCWFLINFLLVICADMVLEVCKDMPAWPGRHLLDGGEYRRYFGLKTVQRGLVEFECRNQREHDIWTQGVTRLLSIVAERKNRHH